MVTIIGYALRQSKDKKQFVSLQLQGDLEMVQSQETGKFYATARKCFITSTFDEPTAKSLIGTKMPGTIERVPCASYEYTVPETGEVIMLAHTYSYVPEEKQRTAVSDRLPESGSRQTYSRMVTQGYPAFLFSNLFNYIYMQIQSASRKNVKIKMALQGPSGSGKTYSSLLVAYGLTGNWSSIAVIDTENHSSELYAHLGSFKVLHLEPPFTPERYIEAMQLCEKEGIAVAVIDSISHEWEGAGGILEVHSNMVGNSYTNWSKLTPRHNDFVQYLLQSPMHIIGTIRAKQDYVLSERNGKQVPKKVGMKGVTREGMDYEFTLVFELDIKNKATATKDRTSLFFKKPERVLTGEAGKQILEWCNLGIPKVEPEIHQRINDCMSMEELLKLYHSNPPKEVKQAFTTRRLTLEQQTINPPFTNIQNTSNNGTLNN